MWTVQCHVRSIDIFLEFLQFEVADKQNFDIFAPSGSLIHRLARGLSTQKLFIQNQLKNKSGLRAPYGLSGK